MSDREESGPAPGLDRFTRNYLIVLGLIGIASLGWWFAAWNPRVGEINAVLEADPQLSDYPYQFRVLSLEKGVAVVSTPRSFEVPVMRFLAVLRPDLRGKAQDHPQMMAAQAELAAHQKRVGSLVREQEDIKTLRWRLDKAWYAERGIYLD